jgi:hypothetical protein
MLSLENPERADESKEWRRKKEMRRQKEKRSKEGRGTTVSRVRCTDSVVVGQALKTITVIILLRQVLIYA